VTVLVEWLEQRIARAPSALKSRVREYALQSESDATELSASLAAAGHRALGRVMAHVGDRSVALDLLAADALITLALLAQAQQAPEKLDEFAATILQASRPDA
jgi:hypothetical protein